MDLGSRLEAGARSKGLTLRALARRAGMPTGTYLYRLGTGDRVATKYLLQLAKLLGTTTTWLISGTGPAPPWAKPTTSDCSGAIACLNAAAAMVEQLAQAKGIDADSALRTIERAKMAVTKLA